MSGLRHDLIAGADEMADQSQSLWLHSAWCITTRPLPLSAKACRLARPAALSVAGISYSTSTWYRNRRSRRYADSLVVS